MKILRHLGHIAAGGSDGHVRLFTNTGKGLKMAKSEIGVLSGIKYDLLRLIISDPVVGIDVSADGQWVIWSTKSYLAVANVSFTGNDGSTHTGFTTKIPAIKRV